MNIMFRNNCIRTFCSNEGNFYTVEGNFYTVERYNYNQLLVPFNAMHKRHISVYTTEVCVYRARSYISA